MQYPAFSLVLKYIENQSKWSICFFSSHVNYPGINEINARNCARNKYAIRHLVCNYWNFDWTPFIFKYIENKCKLTFYYIYGAVNCTGIKEINLVSGILLSGIFGIRHWFEPYSKTISITSLQRIYHSYMSWREGISFINTKYYIWTWNFCCIF